MYEQRGKKMCLYCSNQLNLLNIVVFVHLTLASMLVSSASSRPISQRFKIEKGPVYHPLRAKPYLKKIVFA